MTDTNFFSSWESTESNKGEEKSENPSSEEERGACAAASSSGSSGCRDGGRKTADNDEPGEGEPDKREHDKGGHDSDEAWSDEEQSESNIRPEASYDEGQRAEEPRDQEAGRGFQAERPRSSIPQSHGRQGAEDTAEGDNADYTSCADPHEHSEQGFEPNSTSACRRSAHRADSTAQCSAAT